MIWLTWRQHRIEAIVGSVLLLLAMGFLLVSIPKGGTPASQVTQQQEDFVAIVTYLFSLLPLLIGMFLGAPIVSREVEQGTHRLIWTQSITRNSWLLKKVGLLAGAVGLCAILLGLVARLWGNPVNIWLSFDLQVPALLSYSLYALAVGVALSILVRKTVAVIALTIPAFVLPRLAVFAIRPFFLPAMTYTWDPSQADPRAGLGDWRLTDGLIDSHGQAVSEDYAHQLCEPGNGTAPSQDKFGPLNQCWHDHGFLQQTSYHPATQFWLFQSMEAVMFLALAALLLFVAMWLLRQLEK